MDIDKKYRLVEKSRCLFMCWLDSEICELEMADKGINGEEWEWLRCLRKVNNKAKSLGFKLPESGILGDCD